VAAEPSRARKNGGLAKRIGGQALATLRFGKSLMLVN
jgi:hypothetical protein